MNLLFVILALGGAPELPLVVSASEPVQTYSVPLRWEKRDDRTAVWTLWYGQATEARRVDAGLKTEAIVTGLTNGLWWFAVAGEDSEGVIVETSRVLQLKFPPVRILNICQRIDGKEKILVSYTNTPPGKVGLFYTRQQEDHTP